MHSPQEFKDLAVGDKVIVCQYEYRKPHFYRLAEVSAVHGSKLFAAGEWYSRRTGIIFGHRKRSEQAPHLLMPTDYNLQWTAEWNADYVSRKLRGMTLEQTEKACWHVDLMLEGKP
jgi:hypothetical protein